MRISWFLGSRTDLARVGGKTRWMEVPVGVEAGEGFRGWVHQEGGSPRWIRMDPEGTLAARVDQVVTTTLSPGLEVWARAAEAAGIQVVEAEADVMEGTEEVEVGMEVLGGMTIVIVIAITLPEVTTVEEEEEIIEVVGVVSVNVGEEGEVVPVPVVVGDIKLSLAHAVLNSTLVQFALHTYNIMVPHGAIPTSTRPYHSIRVKP